MNRRLVILLLAFVGIAATSIPVSGANGRGMSRDISVCVDRKTAQIRLGTGIECRAGEEIRRSWPRSGPAPVLCVDQIRRLSISKDGRCIDSKGTVIRTREGAQFVACADRTTGEMRRPSRWSKFTCAASSRTVRWVSVPRKVVSTTTTPNTTSSSTTTTIAVATPTVGSFGIGYTDNTFELLGSNEVLSPTVANGSAVSFAYTGTLPARVNFDTTNGTFSGPVAWNENFSMVSAGFEHSCAVTVSARALCWGRNLFGSVGDGTSLNSRSTPTQVSGLTGGIASISAGNGTTCAISQVGALQCWGLGDRGQIGDGVDTDRLTPTAVTGMSSGVAQVSVSPTGKSVCAVQSNGVKCWGLNDRGQLGNSSTTNSNQPVNVTGLTSGVTQVAVGGSYACALTTGGAVKCWGANGVGELGNPSMTSFNVTVPTDVSGLSSGVTAIGVGLQHACALITGGTVKCWGQNGDGRLGDGTTTARSTPVSVLNLTGATRLSLGQVHSCVIVGGGAKCWGSNSMGQLGDSSTNDQHQPVAVTGLSTDVTSISAGGYHSCAALATGEARCWGMNNNGIGLGGQLGDGTVINRTSPVAVLNAGNPGFPAAVTVTATSTSGRSATWTGTLNISGAAG